MIFLIEYDRSRGQLVRLQRFDDSERVQAQTVRLETELRLNREKIVREVVILEAVTEEALRKTHQRYFDFDRSKVQHMAGYL